MKTKRRTKKPRSTPGLLPQPVKGLTVEVKGGDLIEAMYLDSRKRDIFLLRAKRIAKQVKADHLSDSELRGVSWFAHVPELGCKNIAQGVLNERNFYAGSFLAAWCRDPETVLRLLKRIRDHFKIQNGEHVFQIHEQAIMKRQKLNSVDSAQKKALSRAKGKHLKPPANVAEFAARIG